MFLVAASNRKLLHEQEVERLLILLLAHEDSNVQVAAAQAIGVMAENLASRDAICKLGKEIISAVPSVWTLSF